MSKTCRVDEMKDNSDGSFEVFYTVGTPPLPVARSGQSLIFAGPNGRTLFAQMMGEVDDALSDQQLVAIAAAPWFKGDTAMKNLVTVKGKAVAIDLVGSVAAITLS